MILELYCIKDCKIGFWKPFTQQNEAVAVREFSNMINSNSNEFVVQNYADLELWKLGTFNDHDGTIVSDVSFVVSGSNVKRGE